MANRDLNILLTLKDNATKQLQGFEGQVNKMQPAFKTMAVAGTAAFAGVSVALKSVVQDGLQSRAIADSFGDMTKRFGLDGDKLVAKLKEVSAGTVSTTDLMLASNKAMALGVAPDLETVTKLMEIARVKGRALGLDTTQAFSDIVTGIGRGSPLILDNLGITIKLGEAQEMYAKKLGKTVEEMTDAEKKQALLNAVMESGTKELADLGEVHTTAAEKVQQMKAQISDLESTVGEAFIPVVEGALAAITPVVQAFGKWAAENPETVKTIGLVTFALTGTVAALGTMGVVLPSVITGVKLLGSAFTFIAGHPAILALAAAALALEEIYRSYKKTKAELEAAAAAVERNQATIDKARGTLSGTTASGKSRAGLVASAQTSNDELAAISKLGFFGQIGYGLGIVDPTKSVAEKNNYQTKNPTQTPVPTYNFTFNGDVVDRDKFVRDITLQLDRQSTLNKAGL